MNYFGLIKTPYKPNLIPGIIKQGLVAAYDFAYYEDSVLKDVSGNGNNGIFGAGTQAPTWTATGLQFDGVDDLINIPSITVGENVTIFATISPNWSTISKYEGVINFSLSVGSGIGLALSPSISNDWQAKEILAFGQGFAAGSPPRALAPFGSIVDYTPKCISARIGSVSNIRLTNVDVTRTSLTANIPRATSAILGKSAGLTEFFNGTMHLILIYRRSLTNDEMTINYNAIKSYLEQIGVVV